MSLIPSKAQAHSLITECSGPVVALAKRVGAMLRQAPEEFYAVHASMPTDVKIEADQVCERYIRAELTELTQLPIFGEEQGGDLSLVDRDVLYWLVDPLDGTYNYLRGLPLYCVSIGLFCGMQPLWGVIYDPDCDECFHGGPGVGLFLNDCLQSPTPWAGCTADACLLTGFPNAVNFSDAALKRFFQSAKDFRKIRMLGSAALALAYISVGRAECYYEENIRLWDIAAGLALVYAAGGKAFIKPSSDLPLCYRVCIGAPGCVIPLAVES